MSEPKWLLPEVVLAIHKILIADHGGAEGLRDAGLLDSALNRARQKHHYEKCDVAGLAACYAHALVTNHCFVDGNKRTGATAMGLFLDVNGFNQKASEADMVVMFRALAAGDMTEAELAGWIRDNWSPR